MPTLQLYEVYLGEWSDTQFGNTSAPLNGHKKMAREQPLLPRHIAF